jgi:predicted sugar kinase
MDNEANFLSPIKFVAGTVFVGLRNPPENPRRKFDEIAIKYPSRLDSACTDPGKIFEYSSENLYAAGQINFCVDICKAISIKARDDNEININGLPQRKVIILHAVKLMQKVLKIETGFDVSIENDLELRHCGLGSSASIIQGVGAAINELYDNPIKPMDLIRYLAGNHGEEIDGDNEHLIQVQSVGGSGVCGHFQGGLIILTGRAVPIVTVDLPSDLKIVFGVPTKYAHPDANYLILKEVQNIPKFKKVSNNFAYKIAYRLLNEAIPELIDGNNKPMKDFIFDYRWDMGIAM